MAFIKKRRGNTTYVYEAKYESVENGKQKYKWKVIGKLDADGNVIPSKKSASAEVISLESLKASLSSLDSLNSQNYSQNSPNINNNVNDIENNNDTIVTAVTASMNDTAAVNIAATVATAATATTTEADVADNVSDTTHNNMPKPDMMSDTKIDAVYDGTIEAQASERQVFGTSEDDFITTEYTEYTEASKMISSTSSTPSTHEIFDDIVYDLEYADYAGEAIESVHEQESKESEESSRRNLPQVVSKKPTHFKMGTTKVENTLFDPIKNESIYEATGTNDVKINVSRKNSQKKRIDTLLYIDFNSSKANGVSIAFENRITPYDREIHNAIITLAAAGNNCITPSMIFQLLSGNISDERSKMSNETRDKILASVDKMRFTSIDINAIAEVKAGMITRVRFSSYLIPAERTEVEVNGQIVKDGIKLIRMPPLFEYASLKNQVVTINVKMLDTPINNTPENIELKGC